MHVRRLIAAVVLAMVIASTSVVVAIDQSPVASPEPIDIPAVHAGDAGWYSAGPDMLRFDFALLPWMTPAGAEATGLALTQEITTAAGAEIKRFWFEGTTVRASLSAVGEGGSGVWVTEDYNETVALEWAFRLFDAAYQPPEAPVCGLVHNLQGASAVRVAEVRSHACPEMSRAVRVLPASPGQMWFGTQADGVLLDERFPVPVAIHSAGRLWQLQAFHRGDEPPSPTAGPSHPVRFTHGLIPDERDVDHPFPLSKALADVMASPIPWGVQTMIRDAPGGYLARAAFVEEIDGPQRRWRWDLTATDGVTETKVRVWVAAPQADEGPVGAPRILAPAPASRIVTVHSDDGPFPPMRDPAFVFVDLATLEARWRAAAGSEALAEGMNGWGFHIRCGETCNTTVVETFVGLSMTRSTASCDPGQTSEVTGYTFLCELTWPIPIRDELGVDQTGRMISHRTGDWRQNGRVVVAGTPLQIQEEGQGGAAPVVALVRADSAAGMSIAGPAAASITLAAALIGALYYFWPQLKLGLFAGLRSMPVPENSNRESIQLAVQSTPGIHFQALSRATTLAPGTLRHHLRILARQGRLVAYDVGGYKCYFTARGFDRNVAASAGALKADSARRMLHAIVQDGSLSMGEVAHRSGIKPSSATHHALRLEQAGLLTRHRVGRHIELRATSVAVRALATLQHADT